MIKCLMLFLGLSSLLFRMNDAVRERNSFHLSMRPVDDSFLYTLTYSSRTQGVVLWSGELNNAGKGIISKSERFSDGIGESSVLSRTRLTGTGVRISFPLEMTTQMFFIFDFEGEIDLPESEITSDQGKRINFTPGKPLNITIRYSKEPYKTEMPHLSWVFVGGNGSDSNAMTYINSRMSSASRFVEDVKTTSFDGFYESSATVLPNNHEGLLFVEATYLSSDLWIVRRQGFELIQNGHHGPFPPNFMSFLPSGFYGKYEYHCLIGSMCPIECGAVGSGIKMAALRKINQSKSLVPESVERGLWMYNALYLLSVTANDKGDYTCTISSNDNRNIQKTISVNVV